MLALFLLSKLAEVIWTLFILSVVILVPVLVIGGTVFFILRRNNKNRAVWQNVARNLNFQMPNPKQLKMFGTYNGCEVETAIRMERVSGSETNRVKYYTYCLAKFPHSLRFLLTINSPKGFFSGSNQILLGQPNFDNNFIVKCYDANVLQSLLLSEFPSDETQNLLGDLMLAKQFGDTLKITDQSVFIERDGMIGDENILRQMIEMTAHLGNRFKSARETFPLADWEKRTLASWQNLANENGFRLDAKRFAMSGNYRNFPVEITLATTQEKWQTRIIMKFRRNLTAGFKMMPENSIHKALTWLGVQDIEAGIKSFDDAFIVKAKDIAFAKNLLKPDFCNQMLSLKAQSSDFLVTDEEISLAFDTVLGDQNTLKSYLRAISTAAEMIQR